MEDSGLDEAPIESDILLENQKLKALPFPRTAEFGQ